MLTYDYIILASIRMNLKPRYFLNRPRSRALNGANKIEQTVSFGPVTLTTETRPQRDILVSFRHSYNGSLCRIQ